MDAVTKTRKARLAALIAGKPYDSNQAAFAKAAGITKARITQLLDPNASFGERAAQSLCDKMGLGDGYFERASDQETIQESSNLEDAPALGRSRGIPVVGEVQAGDDGYIDELQYPVGHGEGFVEYWCKDNSAYALRVRGESMHPRYRHGEFIVVTPSIEAQPGRDVVVQFADGRKMLKQLNWIKGGEVQLLSINNHFGPMTFKLSEIATIQRVAGSVGSDALI